VGHRSERGAAPLTPSRPGGRGRTGTPGEGRGRPFLRGRLFVAGLWAAVVGPAPGLAGSALAGSALAGAVLAGSVLAGSVLAGSVVAGTALPAEAAGTGPSSTCTGTIGGLAVSSGSGQTAKAGTGFSMPLAAEVVDTGGCPLGDVDVEFVAPATGAAATFPGSTTSATVASGTDGVASAPTLTANDVSGSYTVLASITGTGFQVSFDLTNTTSGVAATVGVSAGDNQSAKVGAQFPAPLAVNVLDPYGAPVPGADVNFTIVPSSGVATNSAGASFVGGGTAATAQTTGTGTATSPLLVAGSTAGTFSVQVSVSGVSKLAVFTLTDLASAPYTISPGAGTSQESQLGADFAIPLAVTVTDVNGNPVSGARVTFTAPTSGPSGVFAGHGPSVVVTTTSKGVAVAPSFSANSVPGGYIVTAHVPGLASLATFAMVNTARTGATTAGMAGSYWLATTNGQVLTSGSATRYGALTGRALAGHVVGMAATPDGHGYWLVTNGGAVFAFGDARNYGSVPKAQPGTAIVGIAATPDGRGYWLAGSAGAVYAFGDAHYYGSTGTGSTGTGSTGTGSTGAGQTAGDIVGISAAPGGKGYWLAAKNGAVFAYGQAVLYGSAGSVHLTAPIVGISTAPDGKGYWLVARDGGIFAFGEATFYGSGNGLAVNPVVGVVPVPDGGGYWIVSSNGTVAGFGDAGSQTSPLAKGTVVAGVASS
jgi:hypothetical protein